MPFGHLLPNGQPENMNRSNIIHTENVVLRYI